MTIIARLAFLLLPAILLPQAALAAGFGWYYDSFDYRALQAYLGGGTRGDKRELQKDLGDFVARETARPTLGLQLPSSRVKLWRTFIDDGLRYSRLDVEEARFADSVLAHIMNPEVGIKSLRVEKETSPDYVHPAAIRGMRAAASLRGQEFIDFFEYGRSWGNPKARTMCLGDGMQWYCRGAYIILSPDECAMLSEELLQILDSPFFVDDALQRQKYVRGFAQALARTAESRRGMYVYTSD